MTDLRLAPGEPVTPERAGWRHLSFAIHVVGSAMTVGGEGAETAVVVLGGGGARVGDLQLPGRASVWDGLPSAAYLPPGVSATIEPTGQVVTVAVASAPAPGRALFGAEGSDLPTPLTLLTFA